ncbi:MAG TPA: c-type cytochrome [Usitatibacter sp.]|nr:c-type cytochrome [Usitatibacter sp.]
MWLAVAAASIALCESCHGPGGNSVTPMIPSIAAQPPTFLENTLVYFREGLRNAQVMPAIAKTLTDEDITALAKHFSTQKATPGAAGAADSALVARGTELAGKMHCGQCHMARFQGQGQMARLAGQREDYLFDAMVGYRDGKRSAADTTMTEVLYGVSDADLRALAHFMARAD